jgi:hypothetical protein
MSTDHPVSGIVTKLTTPTTMPTIVAKNTDGMRTSLANAKLNYIHNTIFWHKKQETVVGVVRKSPEKLCFSGLLHHCGLVTHKWNQGHEASALH